ncbi:putative membrane protein [Shimia isoporae]|uniref:Putative membrane protein n=1 Tax=Shimia isoporae TaxID=647720 RepID=A0A4R1NX54_9RHOB|nr:DUF2189 domain-containing protein [Shimia isoporae]TCL09742.1 putative membrane protein [Shimia isoporae]
MTQEAAAPTDTGISPEMGVPPLGAAEFPMLKEALRRGARDFVKKPLYGIAFSLFYVIGGWAMLWLTWVSGQSYWLTFAAIGFPLIGPFAAVGLYEVSRRLENKSPMTWGDITGVVIRQSKRQLPSICAVIIIVFLFWFFLAHMIFALFLGLSTMTNVSSSLDIYFTINGLQMLAMGTVVGAGFALLLYMITVVSLPLLLDREVDFVTAMISSFKFVQDNFKVMFAWGALLAVVTFLSMMPGFLGLFVSLPILGHASWHLYAQLKAAGAQG